MKPRTVFMGYKILVGAVALCFSTYVSYWGIMAVEHGQRFVGVCAWGFSLLLDFGIGVRLAAANFASRNLQ